MIAAIMTRSLMIARGPGWAARRTVAGWRWTSTRGDRGTPVRWPAILAGTDVPWAVAGGWAIDLHLGRQTRAHEDIEVAIPRADFVPGVPAGAGRVRSLRRPTAWSARWAAMSRPGRTRSGCSIGRSPAGAWTRSCEPGDRATWVSHRDERSGLPLAEGSGAPPDGIPYLAPATVLLAKAKHVRDKDEADLALTLPTLPEPSVGWPADRARASTTGGSPGSRIRRDHGAWTRCWRSRDGHDPRGRDPGHRGSGGSGARTTLGVDGLPGSRRDHPDARRGGGGVRRRRARASATRRRCTRRAGAPGAGSRSPASGSPPRSAPARPR